MKTEQIHLLKQSLHLEYYKKDIRHICIGVLSNIVLDKEVLKDFSEWIYITRWEKYNNLQQENKNLTNQLKILMSKLDKYDEIIEEKQLLEDSWNKLKEFIQKKQEILFDVEYICYSNVLDEMQEIERGNKFEK